MIPLGHLEAGGVGEFNLVLGLKNLYILTLTTSYYMTVNDLLWMINIILVVIQTILVAFILREYLDAGFTPIGKLLISAAFLFLVQSMILLSSYYYWWVMRNTDYHVAFPLLISTLLSLIGLFMLYRISRL